MDSKVVVEKKWSMTFGELVVLAYDYAHGHELLARTILSRLINRGQLRFIDSRGRRCSCRLER